MENIIIMKKGECCDRRERDEREDGYDIFI